jgi:3',5'-cyclic AMP phosphodiesterase CpdA
LTVRLVHLSDIHITSARLEWKLRDWFNKRYAAWVNFRWLGRRLRFARADEVLGKLTAELHERRPDHIIFSGDATALGFESEFRRAAELLHVGDPTLPPGLAVPGNHDYCTKEAETSGLFERYFAPWQTGERLDGHLYPFAQRVGHVTLIGVNSCTGNRWAWDAGGAVGTQQRERLRQLLGQLEPGPRILVTHYPVCLSSGQPEKRVRGMRDLEETLKVAADGGVSLWLHGHRHHAYQFQDTPLAPFPVICTGSATQNRRWSYGEYTIDGHQCRVLRRVYDPDAGAFREESPFELRLHG